MARPVGTKYIKTPQMMWELFMKYRKWVKENPIKVIDWVGGMAKKVTREKERPLTLDGFECWCYDEDIISHMSDYFANTDNKYSDYSTICSRIRKVIRDEQIAGGMAGIYNPSITQRLNNLTEKTDNKNENTYRLIDESDPGHTPASAS